MYSLMHGFELLSRSSPHTSCATWFLGPFSIIQTTFINSTLFQLPVFQTLNFYFFILAVIAYVYANFKYTWYYISRW